MNNMLVTIGVLGTVTTAVIIYLTRVFGRVNADPLGWMSEQWLAELRASDPT